MQRIVDEARVNGTYLKTPNGKASNLNERQWIQFGDNKGRISRKCPFNGKCTDQSNLCKWCKFTKKFREIYDKGKKLLEKSERNPQFHITYHSSGVKFDEFDHSHMGEVLRRQWLGDKHTSISLHRDGKSES